MTGSTMLKCFNSFVGLCILVSITYLAVIEAKQENVFQRYYAEHRKEVLQKRDVYGNESFGKPKSQVVEVNIPACKPKKHYVTSYISETLAVRSHCVQKVTYSSAREVVSYSTECEGYLCNPKIPYEPPKQYSVETISNISLFPNITYKHSNYDSNSNAETFSDLPSAPYINYSLPEESYSGNDPSGYGPPKQYSLVVPSNDENQPPLTIYETTSFPEINNSVDSDIETPETTPYPTTTTTTTTTNPYNTPSSNRNYTALLYNLTSIFGDGFVKGFQRKPEIVSSVSPTFKPTYLTAVVKDPGPATPLGYVILPARPILQVTSHSSTYQPTSLDLSYFPEPIPLI